MSDLPPIQKSSTLEQWRIIFLCLLFGLSVACLIAGFTLTILIGLHVLVLPYGSPMFFAAPAVGVFGLFKIALRWLFPKLSQRPLDQAASVQNSGLVSNSNML